MAFHNKLKNYRLGKVTRSIILKSTVFLFVENIVHGIFTFHRENIGDFYSRMKDL